MAPLSHTTEEPTLEVMAEGLDPVIGLTLDGRFRVVGSVGKGAMGTVYRAVQVPLNRTVALKVLDSNYGAGRDETFRQRFLVEAALTAKLSHPNTVRIIDYGCTQDGLFYLAMEYLAGETLDRVLQAQGALAWRRVASIGMQVARALREAHDLGVVHRDLKPANIMLLTADTDADHVKVLDFGLVKSFIDGQELEGRAITQHGMVMGSPPYMAPEQGDKNRADPRSDIYSLGIVMFEALTGKPPFAGNGVLDVILKHVNEPVPPLCAPEGVEPVPEAMVKLVNKCLAKSPMDRFDSMEQLIAALQALNAVPISTPPAAIAAADLAVELPRHRTGFLVLGFLAALIIGVAGTAFVLHTSSPSAEQVVRERTQAQHIEAVNEARPALKTAPKPVHARIDSSPRGAQVAIDGRIVGVTPLELELQPNGAGIATAALTLTLSGFQPASLKATGGPETAIDVMHTMVRPQTVLKPLPKRQVFTTTAPPQKTRVPVAKRTTPRAPKAASKLNDDDEPARIGPAPALPLKDELKRPSP